MRRLLNFLGFLKYGQYPSLLQRLTGMRLVYRDALVRGRGGEGREHAHSRYKHARTFDSPS